MSDVWTPKFRLHLRPDRTRSLERRHPWIFSGAVEEIEALADAEPGDVGDVFSSRGEFLGRATVHPESQIVARVFAWEDRPLDPAFWEERIDRALELRRPLLAGHRTNACRVIHSEGDELPGLIVDRYHHILVAQILSAGMARLQSLWLPVLLDRLSPLAVVERGDHSRREPIDVPAGGILHGLVSTDPITIQENGLSFGVDVLNGQKTGFYLDQRENRLRVGSVAEGKVVWNLFGYSGAFSVYAGDARAQQVVHVESSAPACEMAVENWKRNELDTARLEVVQGDAFRFLRTVDETADLIILDPPPFAKNRSSLDAALRAYKDLHLWAFARAEVGTEIFTFSCSQHVSFELFQKVVFGAALDVGASVQWTERLGAGADHPIHLCHPQGEYLKGLRLRVLVPGRVPEGESREVKGAHHDGGRPRKG